jgi:hypothetical protein
LPKVTILEDPEIYKEYNMNAIKERRTKYPTLQVEATEMLRKAWLDPNTPIMHLEKEERNPDDPHDEKDEDDEDNQ